MNSCTNQQQQPNQEKKPKESEDREGQREEVEEKGVCLNVNLPAGRRSDKTLDNRGTRVNSRDVRCYWPTDIIGRCWLNFVISVRTVIERTTAHNKMWTLPLTQTAAYITISWNQKFLDNIGRSDISEQLISDIHN